MFTAICLTCLVLAAMPALMFLDNLRLYRRPGVVTGTASTAVSVLIPARDEEASIGRAVEAALAAGAGVDLEVIVLDDHSRDGTATVVRELAERDARVVLREAPELPEGWCGKQHACAVLAAMATKPVIVFIDADVRLEPGGLAKAAAFLERSGAELVSGIPRQETGGLAEAMVIPLIHFVLLGFLPMRRMRSRPGPEYAAGCGQLFIARKSSYEQMGGHATIRATLHDGVKLPRAFRAVGLKTDLFDATGVASCRMYHGARALWNGLAKNATEGLASPALIGPATVILLGGQVMPPLLLALAFLPAFELPPVATSAAAAATALAFLPRLAGVARFRQPLVGALLHPLGVLMLVAIQWHAFTRDALGRPATWKGRPYPARTG